MKGKFKLLVYSKVYFWISGNFKEIFDVYYLGGLGFYLVLKL